MTISSPDDHPKKIPPEIEECLRTFKRGARQCRRFHVVPPVAGLLAAFTILLLAHDILLRACAMIACASLISAILSNYHDQSRASQRAYVRLRDASATERSLKDRFRSMAREHTFDRFNSTPKRS